jgi:hypothetical protein
MEGDKLRRPFQAMTVSAQAFPALLGCPVLE